MKNPVIKWIVGAFASSIVLVMVLMAYALSSMSMYTLVLCSVGEGGIRIPALVCETHMRLFRSSESDIEELRYGGLDPVLNMKDERKYEIARFLIENGLQVDEPNQYGNEDSDATPLHLSVLYNDPKRAGFLLDQGADPDAKSTSFDGMTPLELARHFQSTENDRDYQAIIEVLGSRASRKQ